MKLEPSHQRLHGGPFVIVTRNEDFCARPHALRLMAIDGNAKKNPGPDPLKLLLHLSAPLKPLSTPQPSESSPRAITKRVFRRRDDPPLPLCARAKLAARLVMHGPFVSRHRLDIAAAPRWPVASIINRALRNAAVVSSFAIENPRELSIGQVTNQ